MLPCHMLQKSSIIDNVLPINCISERSYMYECKHGVLSVHKYGGVSSQLPTPHPKEKNYFIKRIDPKLKKVHS